MFQLAKYILNLTLLVVCTQFVFADNQTDKRDFLTPDAFNKMYPTETGLEPSRDCVNDDSTSDSYGDTCSSWYDDYESEGSGGCNGNYNDDDFDAAAQCCACGGGTESSSGPDWQDDPAGYEFTATISGAVILNDGVQMGDDGDIFAAFDDAGYCKTGDKVTFKVLDALNRFSS